MFRRSILSAIFLLSSFSYAFSVDDGTDVVLQRLESSYQRNVAKADNDSGKLSELKNIYQTAKNKAAKVGGSEGRKILQKANKEMKAVVK